MEYAGYVPSKSLEHRFFPVFRGWLKDGSKQPDLQRARIKKEQESFPRLDLEIGRIMDVVARFPAT